MKKKAIKAWCLKNKEDGSLGWAEMFKTKKECKIRAMEGNVNDFYKPVKVIIKEVTPRKG